MNHRISRFQKKQMPGHMENDLTDEQLLDFYLSLPSKLRKDHFAETSQAAEMTGLSQRTIQLWIEGGLIRAMLVGGKYKVSLASLKAYLKRRING
ncbi:MAG: helix-turn-helix domain-containing protein [Acidobacteriota bacterium]